MSNRCSDRELSTEDNLKSLECAAVVAHFLFAYGMHGEHELWCRMQCLVEVIWHFTAKQHCMRDLRPRTARDSAISSVVRAARGSRTRTIGECIRRRRYALYRTLPSLSSASMQKHTHIVTACPIGRTGHAASAMITENAYPRTIFRERLNTFIAQRERLVGSVDSAADVITFVETFARMEGPENACELLNLAAQFDDYNIVAYEVYKDMLGSPRSTYVSANPGCWSPENG